MSLSESVVSLELPQPAAPQAAYERYAMKTETDALAEPDSAGGVVTPQRREQRNRSDIHPAATLLPSPSPDEYERLKEDIRKNGLRVPVVITADDRILDGRSRVRACTELQIPYPTRIATIDEMLDPPAFVLSMNAARRHLSQDQAAAIWLKHRDPATAKTEAEAGKATRQANLKKGAARKVHVDPSGTEASRTPQAAKATKPPVSKSTLKRVKKVARQAPERLDDVAAGKTSAGQVLKEIACKRKPDADATKGPEAVEMAGSYLGEFVRLSSSIVRQIRETVKAKRGVSTKDHEAAVKAVDKLREALETIEPVWQCAECGEVLVRDESGYDPEPESRYECGECGDGTLRENRCESCNKFAAKVSNVACPMEDCTGDMVRVGWETVSDLRAAKAKQEEEEQRELRASRAAAAKFAKTKAGKAEVAKKRAEEKARVAARLKKEENQTIEWASKIMIRRGEGAKTAEQVAREIHEKSVEEFEREMQEMSVEESEGAAS